MVVKRPLSSRNSKFNNRDKNILAKEPQKIEFKSKSYRLYLYSRVTELAKKLNMKGKERAQMERPKEYMNKLAIVHEKAKYQRRTYQRRLYEVLVSSNKGDQTVSPSTVS